jgi:hypothetical protein
MNTTALKELMRRDYVALPSAKPKRRRRTVVFEGTRMSPEEALQSACVKWFALSHGNARRGVLLHIPNGGSRPSREGAKLKKMGTVAGAPDLLLIHGDGRVSAFELKAEGGTVSKPQREMHARLAEHFVAVHVVRSLEQFEQIVNRILA